LPHYSTLKSFADRSAVAEFADTMFAEITKECAADVKVMMVAVCLVLLDSVDVVPWGVLIH
jgi:hypothetical protein